MLQALLNGAVALLKKSQPVKLQLSRLAQFRGLLPGTSTGILQRGKEAGWDNILKRFSHGESDEEMISRFVETFDNCNIDGWQLRCELNKLAGSDAVPDPLILQAALRACRRNNEYALCIRLLESAKDHCGGQVNTIWPYITHELSGTLDELGIELPEDLCFDKPELFLMDCYNDLDMYEFLAKPDKCN